MNWADWAIVAVIAVSTLIGVWRGFVREALSLAIDRQNQKLERFFDAHHPAVLKAIQMTIDAAHRHGIWVGICGELGADPELTETFVKMGIDELSMSPTSILRAGPSRARGESQGG